MSQINEAEHSSSQDFPGERRITGVMKIINYVGMVPIIVMMFLTVAHSTGRYALGQPIPGLVELSCLMLITMVFLGGAYTMVVKRHIFIGLIVDRFSERTQAIIDSFTYILCLVLAIVALWQSLGHGIYMMEEGYRTTVLGIPHFPFIVIIAFGWGILGLAIVMHLVHLLARVVKR